MSGISVDGLFLVGTPIAFWLIVLLSRVVRHPRVLAGMVVWTAVWFSSIALLPPGPERVARVLLVIAIGIAILRPERFGLLSLSSHELEADRLFRRVSRWLREPNADATAGLAIIGSLSSAAFPGADEWSVAARLFRRSLLRRTGAMAYSLTPATAYERAARSFWRAGLERHLLGRRSPPGLWDESVALRCYHEEFNSLIPREALVERPLIPLGGWDDDAERIVDALSGIPLGHPMARSTRDALAAAMTDELAVARGDRSAEALARQRASAEFMTEQAAALGREESGGLEGP